MFVRASDDKCVKPSERINLRVGGVQVSVLHPSPLGLPHKKAREREKQCAHTLLALDPFVQIVTAYKECHEEQRVCVVDQDEPLSAWFNTNATSPFAPHVFAVSSDGSSFFGKVSDPKIVQLIGEARYWDVEPTAIAREARSKLSPLVDLLSTFLIKKFAFVGLLDESSADYSTSARLFALAFDSQRASPSAVSLASADTVASILRQQNFNSARIQPSIAVDVLLFQAAKVVLQKEFNCITNDNSAIEISSQPTLKGDSFSIVRHTVSYCCSHPTHINSLPTVDCPKLILPIIDYGQFTNNLFSMSVALQVAFASGRRLLDPLFVVGFDEPMFASDLFSVKLSDQACFDNIMTVAEWGETVKRLGVDSPCFVEIAIVSNVDGRQDWIQEHHRTYVKMFFTDFGIDAPAILVEPAFEPTTAAAIDDGVRKIRASMHDQGVDHMPLLFLPEYAFSFYPTFGREWITTWAHMYDDDAPPPSEFDVCWPHQMVAADNPFGEFARWQQRASIGLPGDYCALHFRRGDFWHHCYDNHDSCYLPPPTVARIVGDGMRTHNCTMLYISGAGSKEEQDGLIDLIKHHYSEVDVRTFVRYQPLVDRLKPFDLDNNVLISIVDKILMIESKVFFHSIGSTFSGYVNLQRKWKNRFAVNFPVSL